MAAALFFSIAAAVLLKRLRFGAWFRLLLEDQSNLYRTAALERKILIENYDMKVLCSAASAQDLLDAAENGKQSIYFLDVELKDGEWDGFRLGDRSIRTHRAYLVAADKIETVDLKHNKLRTGGHECLLSRTGRAKLRKKAEENR